MNGQRSLGLHAPTPKLKIGFFTILQDDYGDVIKQSFILILLYISTMAGNKFVCVWI